MRDLFKAFATLIFRGYRLSRIYRLDLKALQCARYPEYDLRRINRLDVERCQDEKISERGWYGGENAYGYGLCEQGKLVCMCWFWNHRRFTDQKLWKISPNQAIMVDLVTAEEHRGRGLASILTKYAAEQLKCDGFEQLLTWVWHSNNPSIRTFEKAGWTCIAFVVNLPLFGGKKVIRLAWSTPGSMGGPSSL